MAKAKHAKPGQVALAWLMAAAELQLDAEAMATLERASAEA